MTDVSKFTTRPDIGTEEEPTIEDDTEEEETIQDDEPEPTDEEDNDTVTTVPLKRPTGTDLGLDNLTTAPLKEPGKLIFASCQKKGVSLRVDCDVRGATPGDNVVVSSTPLTSDLYYPCFRIQSSEVLKHDVVTIRTEACNGSPHDPDHVTYSIIVFRPMEFLGTLEELPDLGLGK